MYDKHSAKLLIVFYSAILIFTLTPLVHGQISFSLSTEQEYNDNPFRSALPTKSLVSSFDGGLEYDFDKIAVGYYGSYINFNAVPERNYYWHQAAAWKNFESSAVGFYVEQRLNKTDYNYYDYTSSMLYNINRFSAGDFFFSLSPNISITKYTNISILDNFKLNVNYSVNKGFETGTTLILGGGFNYKKYLDPVQSGTFLYYDETNTLIQENYTDKNISSLSQIMTYGRVAQSITETTGLAVQISNRSIVSGIASYVKDLNAIYGDESEIFDDPVNYEGNGALIELTQLLGDNLTLKAGYYFNKKSYPSQGLYDEAGNYSTDIMRTDTQSLFSFSLMKIFSSDEKSGGISLGVNYQYINNISNSYWFNYKGNAINLSIGYQL